MSVWSGGPWLCFGIMWHFTSLPLVYKSSYVDPWQKSFVTFGYFATASVNCFPAQAKINSRQCACVPLHSMRLLSWLIVMHISSHFHHFSAERIDALCIPNAVRTFLYNFQYWTKWICGDKMCAHVNHLNTEPSQKELQQWNETMKREEKNKIIIINITKSPAEPERVREIEKRFAMHSAQ